jgi:hypothetical protein
MTNLMLKKKNNNKKTESPTSRSGNLGPQTPFLDVIQDACSRGGRYTLRAESTGLTYWVMVDRNGPFNVSGGGYTGSAALAMAAALRTGTYTLTEGWPEFQPYYQLGLDTTLKSLLEGRDRSDVEDLPIPRGVDWIRNADGDATSAPAAALEQTEPSPEVPKRYTASPWTATPTTPTAGAAEATTEVAVHAIPAPAPAPGARPVWPVEAAGTPWPVQAPEPAPADVRQALGEGRHPIRNIGLGEAPKVDAMAPGGSGTSEGQGRLRHLATRALLWTIRMEDPSRFNLSQALTLVGRSLRADYGYLIRPIEREIIQRWRRAGDDWRTSGEAVSKQKLRKRAPGYVAKEK